MRHGGKLIPAGLAPAALVLALAVPAAAHADPLTCGDAITEDVVLTRDLVECPADGLIAAAPGITIDLDGHRLDGTGAGVGIRVQASDVTIRDGRITGFGAGVALEAPAEAGDAGGPARILGARIDHNAGAGLRARSWRLPTLICDSAIEANGRGIDFVDSTGGTVSGNRIVGNGSGVTFSFSPGGRVERNLIKRNGNWGVFAERSALSVLENKVTFNGAPGVAGGGAFIAESAATIERNTFSANTGDGLVLSEINPAFRPGWRIARNAANENAGFGIRAEQPGFVGTRNVARRNGEPAQCLNFECIT